MQLMRQTVPRIGDDARRSSATGAVSLPAAVCIRRGPLEAHRSQAGVTDTRVAFALQGVANEL
jgi:hypothetical protein